MNAEESIKLVRPCYEALSHGDVGALLDRLDEAVEWVTPIVEGVPPTGVHRGHRGVRRFFESITALEETLAFTQDRFIAEGSTVVVTGVYKARVRSTGRVYETPYVHILTVGHGKILKLVEHFDTASAVRAYRPDAGSSPTP